MQFYEKWKLIPTEKEIEDTFRSGQYSPSEKRGYFKLLLDRIRKLRKEHFAIDDFLKDRNLEAQLERKIQVLEDLQDREGQARKPAEAERIRWKGNDTDLVYLFRGLLEKEFLAYDFKDKSWKQLKAHFVKEDGSEFANLRQKWEGVQNNKSGKSRRGNELEEVVSEVEDSGE